MANKHLNLYPLKSVQHTDPAGIFNIIENLGRILQSDICSSFFLSLLFRVLSFSVGSTHSQVDLFPSPRFLSIRREPLSRSISPGKIVHSVSESLRLAYFLSVRLICRAAINAAALLSHREIWPECCFLHFIIYPRLAAEHMFGGPIGPR